MAQCQVLGTYGFFYIIIGVIARVIARVIAVIAVSIETAMTPIII